MSLDAGLRIIKGQVPYRDFFHITTPGAAYLLALAFKALGVNILSARILMVLVLLGILIVIFLIGKRIVKYSLLLPLGLLIVIFLETLPFIDYSTHRLAVFFSILTLPVLIGSHGLSSAALAGLLSSFSFLMNQNIGGIATLGTAILIFTRPWFVRRKRICADAGSLSLFMLGWFLPIILLLFYLSWKGAIGAFFYDTFLWPFSGYRSFNIYPYFSFEIGILRNDLGLINRGAISPAVLGQIGLYTATGFLPFIIYPLSMVSSFISREWTLWTVSLTGFCLFLSSWTRPDFFHIVHTLPPLILLNTLLLSSLWQGIKRKNRLSFLPFSLLSVLFLLILLDGLMFLSTPQANPSYPVRTERGTVFTIIQEEASELEGVMTYLAANTKKEDPVFIYHWSPALYFLLGKDNPTSFDSYNPLYNSPEQLALLETQLEKSRPPLIIKDSYIAGFFDPEGIRHSTFPFIDPAKIISADTVDTYIQRYYRIAARTQRKYKVGVTTSPYILLMRKNP